MSKLIVLRRPSTRLTHHRWQTSCILLPMYSSPSLSRAFGSIFLTLIIALATFSASHAAIGTYEDLTIADQRKVGGCARDPYPILRQRYRPGTQSAREGGDGINKLNADFACRLSRFLESFPSICIRSAYRSNATQAVLWRGALVKYGSAAAARKWVAPPGSSMHNRGLAADLCNVPGNARTEAARYGLTFRMGHEPWHVEPAGAVRGGIPDGNSSISGAYPSSGIADNARGLLGKQPTGAVAPTSQQEMCSLPDGMVVSCSAIANRGSQPPAQSAPAGNAASPAYPANQQLGQHAQSQLSVSNPLPSSADTNTTSPSAIEQIIALANPTTSRAIRTDRPLILTVSSSDVQTLENDQRQNSSTTAGNGQPLLQVPVTQQTFVSSDLRENTPQGKGPNDQRSNLRAILDSMRSTLLKALAYLRPFGRPETDHYDEWAE